MNTRREFLTSGQSAIAGAALAWGANIGQANGSRALGDVGVGSPGQPLRWSNRYLHLVGATPLVSLQMHDSSESTIYAKLEFMNPSGSTKDRIARQMLENAWRRGDIEANSLVVEASSGSTSMSLALVSAQMGLRFVAVMAEGVSQERIINIKAYGGEVVLVPKTAGILGAQQRAEEIAQNEGAYYTRQFENKDNPAAHREGTGKEALAQIPGGVIDAVVAGVGTGGTLVGIHQACVERGGNPIPVNARPVDRVHRNGVAGVYSKRIPGVVEGASRIFRQANLPGLETVDVSAEEAYATTRKLHRMGMPVGPSSGLNVAAARRVARRLGPKANVVTVLCDRMDRYYSTELFQNASMA